MCGDGGAKDQSSRGGPGAVSASSRAGRTASAIAGSWDWTISVAACFGWAVVVGGGPVRSEPVRKTRGRGEMWNGVEGR